MAKQLPGAIKNSAILVDQSIKSVAQFASINPNWMLQASIFLTCSLVEMLNTYSSLVEEGATIEYAAARSCGAVLKLFMAALLIPLARVSYTSLQNSDFGRYLGLNHRVMDHKLFAAGITTLSLVHAVAHYYHDAGNYKRLPGHTGLTMLATLVAPIGGAYVFKDHSKRVIKGGSYNASVMNPHRVGAAVFLAAYAMHTPDWRMVKYAMAACMPLLLDRVVEHSYYRHSTMIQHAEIIPGTDYMRLQIVRPQAFHQSQPGQSVSLSIPAIEGFFKVAHPFTLVNDNGRVLELLIKRTGPWTNKLYQLIKRKTMPQSATVTGPFGAALINQQTQSGLTMVGAGIGMTPTLAVLNAIASGIIEVHQLNVHVVTRHAAELTPVVTALSSALSTQPKAIDSINLYVTSKAKKRSNYPAAPNITLFSATHRKPTTTSSIKIPVHQHRPHLLSIAVSTKIMAVCGNPKMVKEADKVTRRLGVNCHLESI